MSTVDVSEGLTQSVADLNAKSWWHNKKIPVTNPDNGKQVVLAVKDCFELWKK